MHLKAEAGINATKLQETASEGTPGKARGREFGEKPAAANQNLPGAAADDGNVVRTVFSLDSQGFHVLHRLQLNAFGPVMGRPCIQDCAGRASQGAVHGFLSITPIHAVKLFRQ